MTKLLNNNNDNTEASFFEVSLEDLVDTSLFAGGVAKFVKKGDVIALQGDLGSGKTTFVNFFINFLSSEFVQVTSPTFNLVQIYETETCPVWHFDLYRLKKVDEIYEAGIEQALVEGISLIEWPEIADKVLPPDRLNLKINIGKGEKRIVNITGYGNWKDNIKQVISGFNDTRKPD